MKVKKIDFWGHVFYPFILNPFCWIVVTLFIFNFLFLCWWGTKKDGQYMIYKIKERPFREGSKFLVLNLISMFINTFWLNKGLSYSYIRYLEEYWFPNYPIDDWRRAKNTRDAYHWYLNKRLICFKNIKRQIYILQFDKEKNGEWYVNLPNWEGDKADLQMVGGADKLLDSLSNGKNIVYLKVSNKWFYKGLLLVKNNNKPESGAFYIVTNMNLSLFMKTPLPSFIFGNYPNKIYFKKM